MIETQGIVLKETSYGETSKILSILTRDIGKISVMLKGANSPKSKYIANSQIFSLNNFFLRRGKNFYYIIDADLISPFYKIREGFERVVIGYYLLELADKSLALEQENLAVFELLKKALDVLELRETSFIEFLVAYEIKFISFIGYRPILNHCVNCMATESRQVRFSIENGGIICEKCFEGLGFSLGINQGIYDIMYSALYSSLEESENIVGSREDFNLVHSLLVDYILYSIDRKKLNSLVFLDTII